MNQSLVSFLAFFLHEISQLVQVTTDQIPSALQYSAVCLCDHVDE